MYSLLMLTGAVIEFRGELQEVEAERNPRCFDYRTYLRSKGISCVSSTSSIRVVKGNAGSTGAIRRQVLAFREAFIRWICGRSMYSGNKTVDSYSNDISTGSMTRESLSAAVTHIWDPQVEAMLSGILFGDTGSIDEDMMEDYRRNGTAHILAVSGLHIGLLYSIFRALRKRAAFPGMTALFLAVLGIYGTMTLWTVSVTRAAALILLMELGERLDRPYDLLTSLGTVSMLVLMREPYALYGTSFIMSYLAALSIGVILPALKRVVPDRLPDSIKTSLAVQLGLVPYIAYTFNMIPLGSLIINIPVVFILSLIVSAAVAAVPIYLASGAISLLIRPAGMIPADTVAGALAAPPGIVIQLAGRALILINERFADLDFLSPDVVSPPLFLLAAYYGVLFYICSESFKVARIRKRLDLTASQAGVTLLIIMISCVLSVSDFDRADIVMVDVGQGDCMHLKFRKSFDTGIALPLSEGRTLRIPMPGAAHVIIDGGGSESYNVGKKTLKPYLLKNGIRKVDLALVTHLHTDHYKGIQELAEEGMIKQTVTEGRTGDVIYIGAVTEPDRIEIIWPDSRDPDSDDENKNSLIFKVYINGITILITGDLGEEGEHELVERYRGTGVLDCDVLKVCHHGSRYSSSAEFIEAVSPKAALIGVGKNNTYGHPSDEAIERLEAGGAGVFRTDLDGAIGIGITDNGIVVNTMSDRNYSQRSE